MKFSTKTTYGLRAMVKLAKNYKKGNVSLASISKEEHISQKYLEILFSKLKKSRLVKSELGTGGGYRLAKDPKNITIYNIVNVLEGGIKPFYCLTENGKIKCKVGKTCCASKVLIKVQDSIKKTLKNLKLNDIL